MNGTTEVSFKAAAIKLGLTEVEDDSEWINCLEQVAKCNMPRKLREMFAVICIFNAPKDPLQLFNMFSDHLIYDFARHLPRETAKK